MLRDSTVKSVNCCVALGQAPGVRRRALLKSGASVRALRVLLAVPVAVTVGIALSRPAQAGSTLPQSSLEVVLGSVNYPSGDNPFVLNSDTLISVGSGFAVYGNTGNTWTLTNHGTISGASNDPAVEFASGGVVHNYGTIDGEEGGVHINADFGFLSNCGTIFSTDGDAVDLAAGGYVSNMSSGTISGSLSAVAIADGAGTLVNKGLLTADDTVVEFTDGGTVSNRGDIEDGNIGVSISGGIGIVYNDASWDAADYISGTSAGVLISGTIGTLENLGLIKQSGYANGDAAVVMAGGYIYNQKSMCGHTSVIDGYKAGVIAYGTDAISINNQGLIEGTAGFEHGSDGIILGTFGGQIENGSTAMISAGFGDAILSHYGSFSVINSGQIVATEGDGIDSVIPSEGSFGTGTVSVNNSGLIHGESSGIYIDTGAGTIFNTGQISGQYDSGVYLGKGGTVFSGTLGVITGGENGIVIGDGFGSVTNFGTIRGYYGSGVEMYDGGVVNNLSWFNGESFEGTITGHFNGVYIGGGMGSVLNEGVITGAVDDGVWLNKGGTVFNEGYILGQYSGVQTGYAFERVANSASLFNDGLIKGNTVAGVIMYGGGVVYNEGWILDTQVVGYGVAMYTPDSYVFNDDDIQVGREGQGVRFYNGGTLWNDGEIRAGLKGTGVYLRDGGAVFNSGYIYGGFGVRTGTMSAAYVSNEGEIIGHTVGVQLNDGGVVVNRSYYDCDGFYSGVIYGRQVGVQINGDNFASVVNFGSIGGGVAQNYGIGVQLNEGGGVYNGSQSYNGTIASGVIAGGDVGVQVNGAPGYVFNTGTIWGGAAGVALYRGGEVGNAVYTTVANSNTYTTGGVITGGAYGVFGGYGGSVSVDNAGYIRGGHGGVYLVGGGDVTNQAGGVIKGYYGVLIANGPAYVLNSGFIGGETGVYLPNGGTIVNTEGARIGGRYGVVTGYFDGRGAYNAATVLNSGVIAGETGVVMWAGGYLSNASSGLIVGATGAYVYAPGGSNSTIFNAGTIVGHEFDGVTIAGAGAAYVTNVSGGVIAGNERGVFADNSYLGVSNAGTIYGATGIYSGYGSVVGITNLEGGTIAGVDGTGIVIQTFGVASVFNSGTVMGAYDGVFLYNGGQAVITNEATGTIAGFEHDGIYVHHTSAIGSTTITNSGSIWGDDEGIFASGGSFASVVNNEGGTIFGYDTGVAINAEDVSVNNAGLIESDDWEYDSGLYAEGDYVTLVNQSSGTIAGYTSGAQIYGDYASVDNAGLIEDYNYSCEGTDDGLYLQAGMAQVVNEDSGTIIGSDDGIESESGNFNMVNAGLIEGEGDDGLYAGDGTVASVINEAGGTITGGEYGISAEPDVLNVVNGGLITGGEYDGISADVYDGSVDNLAGGTIAGPDDGIYAEGDNFSVQNSGLIQGGNDEYGVIIYASTLASVVNLQTGTITAPYSGVWMEDGTQAYVANSGFIGGQYAVVMENQTNSLANSATGTITGSLEGVFADYGVKIVNDGLIVGTSFAGVAIYDGGVVLNSGSIIGGETGVYSGYDSTGPYVVAGTVFNAGLITGGTVGVHLFNGGEVANAAGGVISGGTYGVEIGYAGSTIANLGTVYNAGSISGGATGVLLENGGVLGNNAGGVITGGTYGVQLGYSGDSGTNTGTVFNGGVISGGVAGLQLNDGGVVTNVAGGTISGGATGIDALGLATIGNAGLITGGNDGVDLASGGSVVNSGTIIGTAGTGVNLANGSLVNSETGLIQGGTDGVIAQSGANIVNSGRIYDDPAPGHAAVVLNGTASLTNLPTGTISGEVGVLVSGDNATIVDDGSIISTDGGDAIQVEASADPVQITLSTGASISGAIDGGGTAGQITLTGQNTLDDTISNFGTGSALTVAPGASWTGAGNWTINNVNNTGTFQAGMLNVPLNLTGNFNNMGTLQVVVTPTTSTQFTVSGTATLSGNLTYVFAPGTYVPGTTYNFLTAAGGVSGGFSGVSYVGATPYYVGKTTNILITGNTLGSNLVLGRVAPLDDSVFADQNQLAAIEAQAANDELLGKASGNSGADAAACAAAESVMPGQTSPRGTSTAAQMTGAVANAFCGAGGWIEATGSTANVDNSGDGFGYGANDAGFLAGVDRQVNGSGTKLGLAVGYDNAWLDDKDGGKASADTVRIGLYGSQPLGAFTLAADIMYGHGSDTSTRETGVGPASGNFGSDIFNGGVQLDTDLDMQGLVLTPAGGVKFAAVNTGSFAETAPAELAAFKVDADSSSYTSVQPFVNLGLSKIFTTDSQVTITPDVSVGYTLEAGDRGENVNVVAPDGTVFGSGHTNLDAGGAQLAAGISAGKNNWALYAKYAAFVSGNWTAQAGEAGLQIKF